jgi:phage baseplate assembly protein gpV
MPAFVDAVTDADRAARLYRVRIPGLTDGATALPRAQVLKPLGDKSEHTEIRIKPGDRVWLAFEGGDTRYPVIVGYRPRNQENAMDWRRFEHANFEFNADNTFQVIAGTQCIVRTPKALVDAAQTEITGDVVIDKTLTVKGLLAFQAGMTGKGGAGGKAIQVEGGASFSEDVDAAGISVAGHTHKEQGDGNDVSKPHM